MIRGPKNAIPTTKGWVHPKTNELLKSQRITQAQIDEWYGVTDPAPEIQTVADVVYGGNVIEEVEEETVEPEPEVIDLESMTKAELVAYANEIGVELPLLASKKKIINILNQ